MPDQTITQDEAENMAALAVCQYLRAFQLTDESQIGDCLVILVAQAAVVMAQAEGGETAAKRLLGIAEYVRNNIPRTPENPISRMQ